MPSHNLPPSADAGKPSPGAKPPWAKQTKKKVMPNSKEDPNRPKTADGSGGFVARMRLQQAKDKEQDSLEAKETAKEAARSLLPKSDMFMLIKMKKQVTSLAKTQKIKRTSNYEKGHTWYCYCCGQKNKASRTACTVCSRSNKYCNIDRLNPAHGQESSICLRSLQANYLFKDDLKKTNCMDDGRFTPLHNACMSANPGLSESLIEAGAVVEAMTLNGFKPLHFACAANSLPCVDVLVGNGSRVKVQTNKSFLTPLHMAAKVGNERIIELLIEKGALVNAMDSGGRTPLHYSAENGHVQAAIKLVENGADIKLKDLDGWSSKQISEFSGHREFGEFIFRCENPNISFNKMTEFPPEQWHNDTYFTVMDSVQKEKRQLSVMQNMQAEVREMGRLAKGGQSFLQSSFQKKKE